MRKHHPLSASAKLNSQASVSKAPTPQAKPAPVPVSEVTVSPIEEKSTPVLGPAALNTHFFDGKLGDLIPFLLPDLAWAESKTKEEKQIAFTKLWEVLEPTTTPNIRRCFSAIVNSHRVSDREKTGNGNYDPINDMFADDLLYLLAEEICLKNSAEHLALLCIQLEEMISGLCPQGRVTRLFQILIMLKDNID